MLISGALTPEWQLWIPCTFFAGGITMIILGRHLASISFIGGASVNFKLKTE